MAKQVINNGESGLVVRGKLNDNFTELYDRELSGNLKLFNPAGTFSYSFVGSAILGNRNITLPLLTGNDTLVTEAFTQTLNNKSFLDSGLSVRNPANTFSYIFSGNAIVANRTVSFPLLTGNDTFVFGTHAQTLDNKTFRNAGLALLNPATTFSYQFIASAIAANRQVTFPLLTAGDTFVFEAHTQTLTNKTIGDRLNITTGANKAAGTATLVGGTVTVNTTAVTANSIIFLTSQADGGSPGFLRVTAKTAATSFVVTSSNGSDTSTVGWLIIN